MKPKNAKKLYLRPWKLSKIDAIDFIAKTHRHLPKVQGGLWCISVRCKSKIIGVAVVGRPSRKQQTDDMDTLVITRVAVKPGFPNACSMLYGACWRAAKAMGVDNLITYTMQDEPGTSLIASGWVFDGMTSGGISHGSSNRVREKAFDPRPKLRWLAPGSKMLIDNRGGYDKTT